MTDKLKENIEMIPLEHVSASALSEFSKNEYWFYTKYILWIWDNKTTYSLMMWDACHYWIELIRRKLKELYITDDTWEDLKMNDNSWENMKKEFEDKEINEIIWMVLKKIEYDRLHKIFDLPKKKDKDTMLQDTEITIRWYFNELPRLKPLYIEQNILSPFNWLIPLKWIIDLVAENILWEIVIVDHKTATSGYQVKDESIYQRFDLQWANYFILIKSLWLEPHHIEFHQCLKWDIKPTLLKKWMVKDEQWDEVEWWVEAWTLYQPDLRAMCDENWIDWSKNPMTWKRHTNDSMTEMLIDKWVLVSFKESRIQIYTIWNDRSVEIVNMFLERYNYSLKKLLLMLEYNIPFLPPVSYDDPEADEQYRSHLELKRQTWWQQ